MMFRLNKNFIGISLIIPLVLLLPLLLHFDGLIVSCLKIIGISVPSHANSGDTVRIECKYQLQGDRLYSLTLSLNNQEFYRWHPKPPKGTSKTQIFPLNGIDVDQEKSKDGSVTLKNVTSSSSGRYKCEISADSTFQTALDQKEMQVFDSNQSLGMSGVNRTGRQLLIFFSLITCYLYLEHHLQVW